MTAPATRPTGFARLNAWIMRETTGGALLLFAAAIALARPGDAILVAGKGHEDYQLVGDEVLSFDDRVVAAEELERAFGGACSD